MLRSLSQAAAEHSWTVSNLSTESHSRCTSSLEDVDSEDEDESESRSYSQRLGLCIGYIIPDWGHLSLANVGRSWAAGAVALWHCSLFASCGSLIVVNCATAMLRSYIQWFSETRIRAATFYTVTFKYHVVLGFFGAFFRCYILLSLTSDLLRFTYLLCKDAWRPDAFEGYRRLLVGDAWNEIEEGEVYTNDWSVCLSRQQKIADVFFQCFLHISLDVVPFILLICGINSTENVSVTCCHICLAIGIFHIFAFYILWLIGEVYLKAHHFRLAWKVARGQTFARHRTKAHKRTALYCLTLTERRSLYILFGILFHGLGRSLPILSALLTIFLGLVVDRNGWAIVAGMVCCMILLILTSAQWGTNELLDAGERCAPKWIQRFFPHSEALQEWSEVWCQLSVRAQKRQRYPFLMMLGLSALVFGCFRYPAMTVGCVIVLCVVFVRLIAVHMEGTIGWLWAFVESILEIILLNFVVISTAKNVFTDAAVVMLLSAMRQFGFQREMLAGQRLRKASFNIMGCIHLLFVILVCSALETYADSDWSAFGPQLNQTKFFTVQPDPGNGDPFVHAQQSSHAIRTAFPTCSFRFADADGSDGFGQFGHGISLADFGLMASLTYEPRRRVAEACEHYFSSAWHLERMPEDQAFGVKFEMFTSSNNHTTVIAVRGTVDYLDVLQDVSLWIVPALTQCFDVVGLDTSYGAWGMALAELSHTIPLSNIDQDRTFQSVLEATKSMIKQYPERQFYITGHSLGGGVAKLVKLAIDLPQTKLQVVTFSAPGVHYAAHVVLKGQKIDLHEKMRQESLAVAAVRPSNDIISLIDDSLGQQIVAPCSGSAYQCHSIYRTLWEIFTICGSMRDTVLRVPCGWSPEARC